MRILVSRSCFWVFLVATGFAVPTALLGECAATPCLVERVEIMSCRAADESAVQQAPERGVSSEEIAAILVKSSAVIIEGKLVESRVVDPCPRPPKSRVAIGSKQSYLVVEASCARYEVGAVVTGFVRTPCCDTIPVDSIECVISMETIGPVPPWVEQDQDEPKGT